MKGSLGHSVAAGPVRDTVAGVALPRPVVPGGVSLLAILLSYVIKRRDECRERCDNHRYSEEYDGGTVPAPHVTHEDLQGNQTSRGLGRFPQRAVGDHDSNADTGAKKTVTWMKMTVARMGGCGDPTAPWPVGGSGGISTGCRIMQKSPCGFLSLRKVTGRGCYRIAAPRAGRTMDRRGTTDWQDYAESLMLVPRAKRQDAAASTITIAAP